MAVTFTINKIYKKNASNEEIIYYENNASTHKILEPNTNLFIDYNFMKESSDKVTGVIRIISNNTSDDAESDFYDYPVSSELSSLEIVMPKLKSFNNKLSFEAWIFPDNSDES